MELMTNTRLKHWYKVFNRKYFKNELPNLEVKFSKELPDQMMGGSRWNRKRGKDASFNAIWINWAHRKGTVIAIQTLLHEMCHIAIGPRYNHGTRFHKQIDRLYKAGAYKGLL